MRSINPRNVFSSFVIRAADGFHDLQNQPIGSAEDREQAAHTHLCHQSLLDAVQQSDQSTTHHKQDDQATDDQAPISTPV
jgi:hypothetical protein